jgi:DNA-binding protein HU-beta
MNKQELIDSAVERAAATEGRAFTKKDADAIITAALETIMAAVADGQKVTLVGFGTFEPRARSEREGRNPKTGAAMVIPATTVPGWSAGKAFKEKVAPKAPAKELAIAGGGKRKR